MLTLCPLWRKNSITPPVSAWSKSTINSDKWQKPETGSVDGWVLESIYSSQSMSLLDRLAIDNLRGQVQFLANATQNSLQDLNQQAQSTDKMTLQNRQALDLLLARKHGLCGYLLECPENCSIHIPNMTEPLKAQLERIIKITLASRENRKF